VRILLLLWSTAWADEAAFLDQLDATDESTRSAAWDDLEGALNAGPPGPVSVNRHADSIRRVWSKLKALLGDGKITAVDSCSRVKEEPQRLRSQAELVIDLMGSLRGAVPELQAALALADPRLAYFALRSLLRQKQPPPPSAVARLAASDEVRGDLYRLLKKKKTLMPPETRTAEALARSELVRWLAFPSELGCVPDEISPGKLVKKKVWIFRFKGKDGKWLAGVSDGRHSFSDFSEWDSGTPEEHLEALAGTLYQSERP
jgi:hypothetical protein